MITDGACMERNKLKIVLGFVIFGIFFLSAVIFLSVNFISLALKMVVMSNMNYITDISIVDEPILLGLSIASFIVSVIALTKSVLLLKEQ